MRVAFAECVFDSGVRALVRAGEVVHLSPKAFRLLELLLEHRPRVMSKDEIVGALWPDTFVTDGSLANLVAEVRAALGDTATNPRFLRTVHRVGYSFCGEVVGDLAPLDLQATVLSRLRLVSSDREFMLHEGECLVGRASECTVCLESSTVSRHHARLRVTGDQVVLEDLDSKNGTFVNGRRIEAPTPLVKDDRVRFGSLDLALRVTGPLNSTDSLVLRAKG
jgi:DNA-binding winged helix-turn-helix (wHTH) protein